jgi:hypothetical protein
MQPTRRIGKAMCEWTVRRYPFPDGELTGSGDLPILKGRILYPL